MSILMLTESMNQENSSEEGLTSFNRLTFERKHYNIENSRNLMGSYITNWLHNQSMTLLIFDFIAPKINNHSSRTNNVLDWNFDIIHLEEGEKRPLVWVGKKIFAAFDACKILKIDENILENWLKLIEDHYHPNNPYHNATHAADVLQATAFYLNSPLLRDFFEPLEKIQCLIAAAIHDTDHPGKNNTFLMNSNDDLALLYNDRAILESHHAATAFKLTLKDSSANIFQNLDSATYRTTRSSIVDMVLATDVSQHSLHVSNFKSALKNAFFHSYPNNKKTADKNVELLEEQKFDIETFKTNRENVDYVKRILIKCADVSNPARPLHLAITWGMRISEEFIRQTDEEIELGLPLSLPAYRRSTCSIPSSQLGFFDFIISDLYTAWHEFTNLPELTRNYEINYEFWKDLKAKKILTLEEVRNYLVANPVDEDNLVLIHR